MEAERSESVDKVIGQLRALTDEEVVEAFGRGQQSLDFLTKEDFKIGLVSFLVKYLASSEQEQEELFGNLAREIKMFTLVANIYSGNKIPPDKRVPVVIADRDYLTASNKGSPQAEEYRRIRAITLREALPDIWVPL